MWLKYAYFSPDKNELTSYKNKKNHVFLPQVFVQKSPLQNQKSTITVKFSPCSSLEGSDFFVLIRFQGQTTVFLF